MKAKQFILLIIFCLGLSTALLSSAAHAMPTYTYDIQTIGTVYSDITQFKLHVLTTYSDSRGWSSAGVNFVQVPTSLVSTTFTVWLAAPDKMTSFSSGCDAFYSCRVGRNVIINDDRWRLGSPYLAMDVDSYQHMVVNHETGHWLGLDHRGCPANGQLAPVMMQQSKGILDGCVPNAWPTPAEITDVKSLQSSSQPLVGILGIGSNTVNL